MASILTNNSAMVALQTLRSINSNLEGVQSQISTGLEIGTAKDDAAIFAISEVMRSDVAGFDAITKSLDLGSSTLAVASNAANSIGDILEEIKGKIVNAAESGFDAQTLQNEIVSLRDQIGSIVSAAQFNGTNLIDGTAGSLNILASLDRDATGAVSTSNITLGAQNLSTAGGAVRGGLTGSTGVTTNADDATFSLDAAFTADGSNVLVIDSTNLAAGDRYEVSVGGVTASYTVTAEDLAATEPNAVIATAVRDAVLSLNVEGLVIDYDSGADDTLDFGNDGAGAVDQVVSASVTSVGTGGLAALATIDVVGDQAGALASIETLIQTTVTTQAAIGTAERRVEIQAEFQQNLIDSFKSGIGSLVDADLEEASARLQALQVQQQLGTQALSIANQSPQSILSLFR
ncbi:MAG: flagellin [Pseudomonadota bacterium]